MSDDISIPSPTYRVPRHSGGMDPGTRKLALIAAAIGGGLLVVVGGWSMISHHGGGVPVVQAESGPMKVKPVNPGGLQVAGAGNEIFSGGSDTDVEKLAPPPETPDPQALRARRRLSSPQPCRGLADRRGWRVPGGCAGRRRDPTAAAGSGGCGAGTGNRRIGGCANPGAPTPGIPPLPSRTRPWPRRRCHRRLRLHPPSGPMNARLPPARQQSMAKPQVQLAALSSEQAARAEWERMVKRWPALFGGHQPAFSKIERGGQVFWRVRTGGFEGVSQATVFCEHLRAQGGGCSVADF